MRLLKRLWEKVFGTKEGSPCEVMGKEAGLYAVCPGRIYVNVGKVVEINYQWLDNTMHSFASNQDNYIEQPSGVPLFLHDVGSLYAEKINDASEIGSESIYLINKSNVLGQLADYLRELKEEGGFKFQKWMWIALIVIAVFWLWKEGVLTGIAGDIIPSPAPPVPAEVINPKPEGL